MGVQDKTASKFYINGYSRFSKPARLFAVSSAVASRVSEGFQKGLMKDPRVASNYADLWGAASSELRYCIDLPEHVWATLATVADCTPATLQDKTIAACHTSYHWLWRRVLAPAGQRPWSLCRGDIDENLDCLAAETDEPVEPCTRQLWLLLGEGHPRVQLRKVVELLGQCSWSSLPAEQQHGSLALLHRWHPEYGMEMLISRSLLHTAFRLVPHQSKLDKSISRVIAKMDKLERCDPSKATGSHMLVKALVDVLIGRKDVTLTSKDSFFDFTFFVLQSHHLLSDVSTAAGGDGQ